MLGKGAILRNLLFVVVLLVLSAPVRAEDRWGPNRIPNPGLEQGDISWYSRMGAQKMDAEDHVYADVTLDESVAHTGKSSIRFTAAGNTTWWWGIESVPVPARPGLRYKMVGWIKTEGVAVAEGQYDNCNLYIQFRDADDQVVYVDDSPVRATRALFGTNDWTEVERIVRAPDGAVKVVLGCTMTCTGKAWFDDLELREAAPFDWTELETARFIYHFPSGASPPTAEVINQNDRWLSQLEGVFEVKLDGRIDFYKYNDAEQKGEMTGSAHLGHMEGSREIHSILWQDRHDMVHVLMNQVSQSNLFLTEGLATYWDGTLVGKDPRQAVKFNVQHGAIVPLEKLLNSRLFSRMPPHVGHQLAGSFVGYLIEAYSLNMFMDLYRKVTPEMPGLELQAKIREVFGVEFSDVEAAWKNWVLSLEGPATP